MSIPSANQLMNHCMNGAHGGSLWVPLIGSASVDYIFACIAGMEALLLGGLLLFLGAFRGSSP
jgi:uncharacterized membrane protein